MSAIIEVIGLTKKYGDFTAVADVSFSVEEGAIFGILGPNGAGKTTTLEIIEGVKRPTSGKVLLGGRDVERERAEIKKLIGVQPQSSAFFTGLKLGELLDTFAALYGVNADVMEIFREVELVDKVDRQLKELSGGQQQRFSIAVALVNDPKVLFLDEPTTGLDPQSRRNVWELIRNIRKRGRTVVLTTHYMEEAQTLCDRIAIMDAGRIVALDTPAHLIEALLAGGFSKPIVHQEANLEDVFLRFTGHQLRE